MAEHSITVGNVELVSVSDGFPIRSPSCLSRIPVWSSGASSPGW